MRIGSLFSGYDGLDAAVQSVLGGTVAWHSDIDPGACRILAHHWPDTPNLGDISAVDWAEVEPVDIVTGGFPCQDVSHAGRRAGLIRTTDGRTRSGLWGEMLRAIDTLKPRLVVAENVRGLLSATADSDVEPCPICLGDEREPAMRALGAVLGDLADIGMDAAWYGLRAADIGAAHGRFRVFVVAYPHGDPWRIEHRDGRTAAHDDGSVVTLLPTPDASVMNDGETPETWLARRDRLKATAKNGNGMGTPLAMAVRLLPTPDVGGGGKTVPADAVWSGNAAYKRDGTKVQVNTENAVLRNWGDYAAAIARWETVLGRPAPAPTETGPKGSLRLSARFVEWLMGLPEGHVTDPAIWHGMTPSGARNAQLKALGNGVVPQQGAAAIRHLLTALEAVA